MMIQINTQEQKSRFSAKGETYLNLKREMNYAEEKELTIAYARGFCLFRSPTEGEKCLWVHSFGQWQEIILRPHTIIFTPAFGLIQWKFPAEKLDFEMHSYLSAAPVNAPAEAIAFDIDPEVINEPKLWLNHKVEGSERPVGKNNDSSIISFKIKNKIAEDFHKLKNLETSMQELNLNPASASRCFKKTFGISPVQYRNKIRLTRAQELLLVSKEKVTNVAHALGFSDSRQFQRKFLSFSKVTPSSYKLKNSVKKD